MAAFVALFLWRNQPGFTHFPLLVVIGSAYAVLYVLACLAVILGRSPAQPLASSGRFALVFAAAVLLWLFLESAVIDYFQPISLHDEVIALLAGAWGTLLAALLTCSGRGSAPPRVIWPAVVALLGPGAMALAALVTNPLPTDNLEAHDDLFTGGDEDYAVYRIPALLVIPAGSRLASGAVLPADRVLAFAEARRDGALDTGAIDLVVRSSDNGGRDWSEQRRVCRHERDGRRGKCGNATPVFDQLGGRVWLGYNLSGLGEAGHHAMLMASNDGGDSWGAPRQLATDDFVFGPGHGIQKRLPPQGGRLLLPGYTDRAAVYYSDDQGRSWTRSRPLDTGNESEIAELSDGSLYLTTRHHAPIGHPPEPGGRLYALSDNGGTSWSETRLDSRLVTPVSQASILRLDRDGGLLFSNPAQPRTRTHMTLRYSPDDGKRWSESLLVYPGPAGYSELGRLSDGSVLLLYERGRLSYSEAISLARLAPGYFGGD